MKQSLAPRRSGRQGFTLVETLIAVSIGAVLFGVLMLMYAQGNRSFYKTTEHTSLRGEAMLLMEQIARDLEEIVVSPEDTYGGGGGSGIYHLLQPYRIMDQVPFQEADPITGEPVVLEAGRGLEFYRFHHMASGAELSGAAGKYMPLMVARRVRYSIQAIDPSDESQGFDLYRNETKLNGVPLDEVLFHKEPPKVAVDQIKGSPHAILSVTVVPKGGLFGNLGETDRLRQREVLQRLRNQGSLVSRTFHLIGYESMYTQKLFRALQKKVLHPTRPLAPLYAAVYRDAYETAPRDMLERIRDGLDRNAPPTFRYPSEVFHIEWETDWAQENFAHDASWLSAGSTEGKPVDPSEVFGNQGEGGRAGSRSAGSANAGSGSSNQGGV